MVNQYFERTAILQKIIPDTENHQIFWPAKPVIFCPNKTEYYKTTTYEKTRK